MLSVFPPVVQKTDLLTLPCEVVDFIGLNLRQHLQDAAKSVETTDSNFTKSRMPKRTKFWNGTSSRDKG